MKTSGDFVGSRDRALGHVLEIGLYRDHPRVMLGCLRSLAVQAWELGRSLLRPCFLFLLPLLILLPPLARFNDYRPLHPGESTLLTVTGEGLEESRLVTSDGVHVESEMVRIPSKNQVVWRLSARSEGEQRVDIRVGENRWTKSIKVSRGPALVSLSRSAGWVQWLLHPYESRLNPAEAVSDISVEYPKREFWLGYHQIPWLLPFILTFLTSLILLGRVR